MNKYLLSLLLLLLSLEVQAQLRFGYVDQSQLIESFPEDAENLERLNAYAEQLISQTDSLQQVKDALMTEISAKESEDLGANEEALNQYYRLRGRLEAVENAILDKQIEIEERVTQRRQQLLQPLISKFNRAMDEIALENDVQVILDPLTTPADFKNVLASEGVTDLTEQVKNRLKEY